MENWQGQYKIPKKIHTLQFLGYQRCCYQPNLSFLLERFPEIVFSISIWTGSRYFSSRIRDLHFTSCSFHTIDYQRSDTFCRDFLDKDWICAFLILIFLWLNICYLQDLKTGFNPMRWYKRSFNTGRDVFFAWCTKATWKRCSGALVFERKSYTTKTYERSFILSWMKDNVLVLSSEQYWNQEQNQTWKVKLTQRLKLLFHERKFPLI